jgi:hypothetical protein
MNDWIGFWYLYYNLDMKPTRISNGPLLFPPLFLVLGDLAAMLLVTAIGFYSHGSPDISLMWPTTFLPLAAAWTLIAPWLGVYRAEVYRQPVQTWRPVLGMLLSAPMAGWLRGLWLNSPIQPSFVLVIGLSSALTVVVWRLSWAFGAARSGEHG